MLYANFFHRYSIFTSPGEKNGGETILILGTYISRRFLEAFGTVLLTIAGLVLLFDMIELVRRAAARTDLSFALLFSLVLLKLPRMVNLVLPFAVMLGGMVVLWRLSRSRELVVMRAVGISAWQFLLPVLLIVFLMGVGNVAFLNPLGAALYARYERQEDVLLSHRTSPLSLSEGGLWLREVVVGRQSVVHASRLHQEGLKLYLRDISVFLFDEKNLFVERVEASSGILQNDMYYELYDVWVMQPGKLSIHHDTLRLPTTLTVGRIQENFASPETISVWELPAFIRFFEAAGFSVHAHRLYLYTLVASPFLLCAMVLVAAAFVMPQTRRGRGGLLRIIGATGAGFLLYFFSKVTHALGQSGILPLVLAAWSPVLITGLLGLAAVFHLEDG